MRGHRPLDGLLAGVTRRKRQRPGIAKNDKNNGTKRTTNNPTMQPPKPTNRTLHVITCHSTHPGIAAAAHSGGAVRHDSAALPARPFARGDLLLYLPGWPVVVDVCVTHPLASSAVAAAALGTGERDKHGRTGTGTCRFVPMSHENYYRAAPAFALLHELAEFAASTGAVSKTVFMENAIRNLSTTLRRCIARQLLPSAQLQALL